MNILDEVQAEAWHILASLYTYQEMIAAARQSATRYELANQLIALNALAEILIIRTARLADKRRDARSISMLLKRGNFSDRSQLIKTAAEKFLVLAEPVVKIRHEQVAHMKPGVLSSYPVNPLPVEVLRATEALITLIDLARDKSVVYAYQVGSLEAKINLRASLADGTTVM